MSGKAKKSAAKEKRKAQKKAAKAAKNALYRQYAEEGRKNGGSKRTKARRKEPLIPNTKHASGICPNTGCHRCHPATYNIPAGLQQAIAQGTMKWNPMLLKVVAA